MKKLDFEFFFAAMQLLPSRPTVRAGGDHYVIVKPVTDETWETISTLLEINPKRIGVYIGERMPQAIYLSRRRFIWRRWQFKALRA